MRTMLAGPILGKLCWLLLVSASSNRLRMSGGASTAAQRALWSSPLGNRARAYLRQRGFTDTTIRHAGLGFNAGGRHSPFATWGLPAPPHRAGVWLPRGIVIPWYVDGAIWKIAIRRPAGTPRYVTVTGSTNVLYNVDALQPGRVAMLVEGPFDALAVEQAAGDLVASVASGTTGARHMRWITRLAMCSEVLIALDNEAVRSRTWRKQSPTGAMCSIHERAAGVRI